VGPEEPKLQPVMSRDERIALFGYWAVIHFVHFRCTDPETPLHWGSLCQPILYYKLCSMYNLAFSVSAVGAALLIVLALGLYGSGRRQSADRPSEVMLVRGVCAVGLLQLALCYVSDACPFKRDSVGRNLHLGLRSQQCRGIESTLPISVPLLSCKVMALCFRTTTLEVC
jgi:hypothetical protein